MASAHPVSVHRRVRACALWLLAPLLTFGLAMGTTAAGASSLAREGVPGPRVRAQPGGVRWLVVLRAGAARAKALREARAFDGRLVEPRFLALTAHAYAALRQQS
jgi:hypothetical protein